MEILIDSLEDKNKVSQSKKKSHGNHGGEDKRLAG